MTRIQSGVLATLLVAGLVACASTPPSVRRITTHGEASRVPLPRPSAASGPCASVTTTTPIGQVPAGCAALWAPYGVTKVPPANLTDSTPVPPTVVNETRGAVSDAQARAWALAANRAGTWLQWAEANDQYALLARVEAANTINGEVDQLLHRGVVVEDPSCDLFAKAYGLFQMTRPGRAFFASYGESTTSGYVLEETYPGPCALVAVFPDGHQQTVDSSSGIVVTVAAGSFVHDRMLGDLWVISAGAFCTDPGVPTEWCA